MERLEQPAEIFLEILAKKVSLHRANPLLAQHQEIIADVRRLYFKLKTSFRALF